MKLPENYFNLLISEFKEIIDLINKAETPEDKLYYFSASFGAINRVMNFYCEPILIFMHQVLQNLHQNMSNRLGSMIAPQIRSQSIPDELFLSMFSTFEDLVIKFEKKEENEIRIILEKLSNIAYATSGNGFYLFIRDKLKIE